MNILQRVRRLAHPVTGALCAILLGAGAVWAATTVPPGTTTNLHADHGFDALTIPKGQKDVALVALPAPATATPTTSSMIEGVPVCTDHTKTAWHPLVKKDAAGKITCTYGHEHHADPNLANDVFGPPGAWFGASGQSISYPWQTSGSAGLENDAKHEGYKWYVEVNKACRPVGGQPGCLRAWRVLVHSMGSASDAVVRFHSYSIEALVEYNDQQGIVRHGGHMDFGHLAPAAGGGFACPVLATNPDMNPSTPEQDFNYRPVEQGGDCGEAPRREGGIRNAAHYPYAPRTDADRGGAGWYGGHLLTQLSTTIEDFGPVDYDAPANQLFYPSDRRQNGSKSNLGNMAIVLNYPWMAQYTSNGRITFDGYTDRLGNQSTTCTAPGMDCPRLKIENAPAVVTYWNMSTQGDVTAPEYDVDSPVTGKSLIVFPN